VVVGNIAKWNWTYSFQVIFQAFSPATVTAHRAFFSTRNLQFSFKNMSVLVTCCKTVRNLAASSKGLAWKPEVYFFLISSTYFTRVKLKQISLLLPTPQQPKPSLHSHIIKVESPAASTSGVYTGVSEAACFRFFNNCNKILPQFTDLVMKG